jgi:hypothetical protein
VQLTTMSRLGEEGGQGHRPRSVIRGLDRVLVVSKLHDPTEWMGEPPRDSAVVSTTTSWTRCASAVTAPRAVAPKPMTTAVTRRAVVAGRAASSHGVQHRAVAGELVVLVEDVQADAPSRVQWFIASNAIRVSRGRSRAG